MEPAWMSDYFDGPSDYFALRLKVLEAYGQAQIRAVHELTNAVPDVDDSKAHCLFQAMVEEGLIEFCGDNLVRRLPVQDRRYKLSPSYKPLKEEYKAAIPYVLSCVQSATNPASLVVDMEAMGFHERLVRTCVWWMIAEGYLTFGRRLTIERTANRAGVA